MDNNVRPQRTAIVDDFLESEGIADMGGQPAKRTLI